MYFLRRIIFSIPLLLVISLLAFVLVHLAPGGPFDSERKPASPEIERNLQAKYHLDEPIWKQYLSYLDGLVHGDLGPSMKYRDHDVNEILASGLPVSLTLGFLAFGFATLGGIVLGFLTARHQGSWMSHAINFVVLLSVCVPGFVVAPILILVFAMRLHWFPVALWGTPWHMVLPAIALGLFFAGKVARILQSGMLEAMQSEFMVAARAKGLGETRLLARHAFRMALLPVVSFSGPMLADLLTGSFVVENIFQIPGIGVFLVNGSLNRDYPVVVGLSLLYAALLIGLNLVVDYLYTLLDPRVSYE